jgi:hypothetical protein
MPPLGVAFCPYLFLAAVQWSKVSASASGCYGGQIHPAHECPAAIDHYGLLMMASVTDDLRLTSRRQCGSA